MWLKDEPFSLFYADMKGRLSSGEYADTGVKRRDFSAGSVQVRPHTKSALQG